MRVVPQAGLDLFVVAQERFDFVVDLAAALRVDAGVPVGIAEAFQGFAELLHAEPLQPCLNPRAALGIELRVRVSPSFFPMLEN